MGIVFIHLFIISTLVFFGDFVNHYSIKEEKNKAAKGFSQVLVALPQERALQAKPSTSCFNICNSPESSLQGRELPGLRHSRDDGVQRTMEMWLLYETQQDERSEMWKVRHHVASMLGYILRPWRQVQEGGLDLFKLGRRRPGMVIRKKGVQIATQDQKRIYAASQSTQSQRGGFGTTSGSTMEYQAAAHHTLDGVRDGERR